MEIKEMNQYLSSPDGKSILWDDIREYSKSVEIQMDPLDRKRTGSFYTSLDLTDVMIKELVSKLTEEGRALYSQYFLEPCVGTGNFVFSYLKEISRFHYSKAEMEILINHIYAADIYPAALEAYKAMLTVFVKVYFDIELTDVYFKTHLGTGLLIDTSADEMAYINLSDVFGTEIAENGFDIIVTNPPYKNLKADRSQYMDIAEYEADKEKYAAISNFAGRRFIYGADGVLNMYKLFTEAIIHTYAKADAWIDLLIPASILSDKTCEKLRTYMLTSNAVESIKVLNENNEYVDAQQALCAVLLKKGSRTRHIRMTKDYCRYPAQITDIHIEDILNSHTGNAIIAINNYEYAILRQMRSFPVIKDLDFIVNYRGELDLSAHKASIVHEDTGFSLLRGRNIEYYGITDTGANEYVLADFVQKSKKQAYVKNERLICQQVVNIHKERRLAFAYIPKNYVLGNSCNFIAVHENNYGIDIYAVLGLLNTSLMNWLFKLTSSNNHVNNYEIDCFPIPVKSPLLSQISKLVQEYLKTGHRALIDNIEDYAYQAYGINRIEEEYPVKTPDEIAAQYLADMKYIVPEMTGEMASDILDGNGSFEALLLQKGIDMNQMTKNIAEGITDKYIKLKKGEILNHTTFKLSDLDLEMIRAVPQGGSWKDIPKSTVEKSKRLKRITQTGGRTTLYGRIDYDKPSYTITTYFNRPGNGTYVHPVHDRVLSVREAARFQCFKDDYYFYGNKTQMLKQVGNAVPTLLAYQLAERIVQKTHFRKSVDLFCGAGGLTSGFREAGIMSVLSNDIEPSACITLKINHPEINVLCGDITDKRIKDRIIKAAVSGGAEIICGGPPCQGFSMAGYRSSEDPRNQLFRDFIEIVRRVKPKVIIFENVEGLLSFQKGHVYKDILKLFSEVGYYTEGRTLMANEYGVPQKRKRVFIICTRIGLGIMPGELFPKPITPEADKQCSARETIGDLEKVACSETAAYIETKESDILKLLKGKISYKTYTRKYMH